MARLRLPRPRVAHKKFVLRSTTAVLQGMGERFDPRIGVTGETGCYISALIVLRLVFDPYFGVAEHAELPPGNRNPCFRFNVNPLAFKTIPVVSLGPSNE